MNQTEILYDFFSHHLSGKESRKLKQRTKRAALTIAPVYGDHTGTSQIDRWELMDKLPGQPPREVLTNNEDECRDVLTHLLAQLTHAKGVPPLGDEVKKVATDVLGSDFGTLTCPVSGKEIHFEDIQKSLHQTSDLGSSEIPIGYVEHPQGGGKFEVGNVVWLKPPLFLFSLREHFESAGDAEAKLIEKVQRKSHRTDRRQTGDYKTNRELRWEAHPDEPQAATRDQCWEVEANLLCQTFTFEGAPDVPEHLVEGVRDTLNVTDVDEIFRCPISGQSIIYSDFMEEVTDSDQGRSSYQVGHMTPIALPHGYHTVGNISWITELGNGVQADNSLEETAKNIFEMAEYHLERLGISWSEAIDWESPEVSHSLADPEEGTDSLPRNNLDSIYVQPKEGTKSATISDYE